MKHNILFTAVLLALLSGTADNVDAYGIKSVNHLVSSAFYESSVSVGNIEFQTNYDGTAMVTGLVDKTVVSADIPENITVDGETYTVTTIKMMAFGSSCTNLSVINLPATLAEIQDYAFYGAPVLAEINVAEGNSTYSSADGILYSADGKSLIICPCGKQGNIVIPEGTENICESAFARSLISGLEMPSSVTSVGRNAFDNCSELETVELSESLTEISNYMFTYCKKLKEINIPLNVHTIGEYAFNFCSSIVEVTIPGGVNTVKSSAFYKCGSLEKITIGKAVTIIGAWAFEDCILKEIYCNCTTPPSIDGSTAFKSAGYDVYNMATLHVPAGCSEAYKSEGEWANFVNVEEFSNADTEIVDNGLIYHVNDNGKEVTLVGMDETCTQTDIVVPQDIEYNNELFRVTAIGKKAFYENTFINSIVLPRYSKTIADSAFFGSKVSAIEISERMDSIGKDAFAYCKSLKEFAVAPRNKKFVAEDGCLLDIDKNILLAYPSAKSDVYTAGDEISEIACSAFKGSDIRQVDFGSVAVIGESAFEGCTSLQPIRLPLTLRQIGSRAFAGCESDTLYVAAYTPPLLGADAFDGMYDAVLVVPAGCFMTYIMAEGWYMFYNVVEETFETPGTVDKNGYTFYELKDADDLYWFAKAVNDGQTDINALLANDIVINSMQFEEDGTPANPAEMRPWKPVGAKPCAFSGLFDGNGHTIEGLYINDDYGNRSGLFSEISSTGQVMNVTLKNAYVKVYSCFGSICGYNDGIVENCMTDGVISLASIDPSSFSAGAVCGSNFAGVIKNCVNRADVIVSGPVYAGAICGDSYGTIKTCSNEGVIVSAGNAGGICGYTDYGKIENCCNIGTVEGGSNSFNGGIVASMNFASVANCYSYGVVKCDVPENVNPVCGLSMSSEVSNCYYLDGTAGCTVSSDTIKGMELDQFRNGEVAHKLQYGQTEEVWGQTIGTDSVPMIFGGSKVFRIELDNEGEIEVLYANSGNIDLPAPEKTNYIFIGWFDDTAGGTQYFADSALEKDMTLYARWQKIGVSDVYSGCWLSSEDGCIIIEGEFDNVAVFTSDGVCIYRGNDRIISCDEGVYIVKTDNLTGKIVVR